MLETITTNDELKKKLIIAGRKAVEELIKVAKESIITNDETDLTADKLKNAAQAKRIAIEDAFTILQRIADEEAMMSEDKGNEAVNNTKGFAERFSK
jgi:hypothetical protein